ncbi:MFS transporter [Tuwongella immobilis]|uniref:Major facilitator superfamily (MFS) profile domain-containing protein n=1 Tax=Tuwongella immobilis TaxID=692036 RepID=A0A6C2YL30_9BACT|nr:MFS transporter [Tuwongella immobilis]VIP01939.1 mfs transporter : MFS transporter OS=Opitutaceae bacterium TAV5 GN=OPIT5_17790 PE=4 SV=1: MFS_1 [Tuwongella immobilis]VTR99905.1 mfs transporter : MFS transporter OS=Opitutaceae bacterium TAV5 GN=OPIT5_17790 PE=4 SV=1: MFS_1 [Tuwongella immobilis]
MNDPLPPVRSAAGTAWLTVLLLMPVAMLNYLDRQMLASMATSVMADIPSLGNAENPQELWGFMLGQFKWVYAAFSLIGGYLADRFSRKLTICASLFVWSGVTAWTGQVTTYNELLWARSLMGFSEAFYIPAALALIADHHSDATRSRAVGLHQLGISLGVIAGGFGGYAADAPGIGWRNAFGFCGLAGMLYALPLLLLLRGGPSVAQSAAPKLRQSPGRSLLELLRNGSFLLLVLYFTLPAMAGWVVRDWMPKIFKDRYQLGQGFAGVTATLYWQIAAIIGVIVGGYLADRAMQRNIRGRIWISAIGMAMIVPAIFGVGFAPTVLVAVLFLVLFGLGWGFFDCNNMPILSQIVRPELRATGYGVMNFVSISCGGLADWMFGKLQQQGVPLSVSFGGFAALAVVSIVLVLLIRPRAELASSPRSES